MKYKINEETKEVTIDGVYTIHEVLLLITNLSKIIADIGDWDIKFGNKIVEKEKIVYREKDDWRKGMFDKVTYPNTTPLQPGINPFDQPIWQEPNRITCDRESKPFSQELWKELTPTLDNNPIEEALSKLKSSYDQSNEDGPEQS